MTGAPRRALLALLVLLWVATGASVATGEVRAAPPATDRTGVPGSLVLCGGGELPQVVFDEFLARAGGGTDARLVVIPTASSETESEDRIRRRWRARGAAGVDVLHARSRAEADREGFAAPLEAATGVWLSGGGQSQLAKTYLGTAVERQLGALLARGGVIGGTSAGAAVQSRLMIAGGENRAKLGRGFDLLPGSVVDQHFLVRHRRPRLVGVVRDHPDLVGFGIDESTALVVSGHQLRVIGESTVTVLVADGEGGIAREFELFAGGKADLRELRASAGEPAPGQVPAVETVESSGGMQSR